MNISAPPAPAGVNVAVPTPAPASIPAPAVAAPPVAAPPINGSPPVMQTGGPVNSSWSSFAKNANMFEMAFQLLSVTALFFIINASAKRIKTDRKLMSDLTGRMDELESKQSQLANSKKLNATGSRKW